jgi:predicted nucleic acid-binding Zn ribbon protein
MSEKDDRKTKARRYKGDDTLAGASDLVKGLMENVQKPLGVGFLRLKLEVQWAEIVGSRLAEITAPAAFHNGVLDVWVAHSTWMQELWFVKDEIRQKVNGAILRESKNPSDGCKEVRFTLNRRQASAP